MFLIDEGAVQDIVQDIVYVQLMNEGSISYRPVDAIKSADNVYILGGHDIYNPEDEEWEFLPGNLVVVEKQSHGGKSILVAIRALKC